MDKIEKSLKSAISAIEGAHDMYVKSVMLVVKKYKKESDVLEYIENNSPSYSELVDYISRFNSDI